MTYDVIVPRCTLFVTSQYITFWRNLLTQHARYSTRTLLTTCCTMCHCNQHIIRVPS